MRGEGGTVCHRVVLTYKQAHALLIYMKRVDVTHTRTFFSSNKVSTGDGSTAGKCAGEVIYPETL